jgi:hypothetical protein
MSGGKSTFSVEDLYRVFPLVFMRRGYSPFDCCMNFNRSIVLVTGSGAQIIINITATTRILRQNGIAEHRY